MRSPNSSSTRLDARPRSMTCLTSAASRPQRAASASPSAAASCGDQQNQLMARLGRLAGADAADVEDRADAFEDRRDALQHVGASPAMISVVFSAPIGPPETGASTNPRPRAASASTDRHRGRRRRSCSCRRLSCRPARARPRRRTEQHLLDVFRAGDHRDDDVAAPRRGPPASRRTWRRPRQSAPRPQRGGRRRRERWPAAQRDCTDHRRPSPTDPYIGSSLIPWLIWPSGHLVGWSSCRGCVGSSAASPLGSYRASDQMIKRLTD